MIKNEKQILENTNSNIKTNIKSIKKHSKKIIEQKSIQIYRLIMNIIFSFIMIAAMIDALVTYKPQWRMFYFLSSWSFVMSAYYIISVTIIELFREISHKFFKKYNSFIRNYFIRICVPFSITAVFVYWELVLLGSDFEKVGDDSYDYFVAIFLNGMILVFLFFDMFAAYHIYKHNRVNDLLILTIIIICYYLLLCLGKYLNFYEPYDFMARSDVRQIVGVGIIVYLLLLNGYIVFDLLAYCCFKHQKEEIANETILDNEMNSRQLYEASNLFDKTDYILNYKDISTNNKTQDSNNIIDNNTIITNNNMI
jgi:hypothetical protein